MTRLQAHKWISMQQRLDAEAGGTMEVVAGDESFQCDGGAEPRLHFGPYGTSPIRGLHFDVADDTAAS